MFKFIISVLQLITNITIRFPIRMVMYAFAVPNCKIVYKNGHVEKFFFSSWSKNSEGMKWDSGGSTKTPKIINVGEIMTITEIY
jgi:hypothetical protein